MQSKSGFLRYAPGIAAAFAVALFSAGARGEAISDFNEFINKIGANPGGSFELADNIDAGGKNFVPVGTYNKPFTGRFDGNGKTIYNIRITGSIYGYVGLFGYVGKGAVINNLGVIADTASGVSGLYAVGILAGGNDGEIRNCYSKGVVSASRDESSVGGLAGVNGGVISGCYSTARVSGRNNAGGLVGTLTANSDGALITNSYFDGTVSGAGKVGGIAGYVFGGAISYCLAVGSVSGTNNTGGIIGYDYGSIESNWKTAGKTNAGGSVQKAAVAGCFWNYETTGQHESAGGTGQNIAIAISTEETKNPNTFREWDRSVWNLVDGYIPSLKNAPPAYNPYGVPIENAAVSLAVAPIVYNGREQRPRVTVTIGGEPLTEGRDYSVSTVSADNEAEGASGGINAGVVRIMIRGMGDYMGSVYENYTIEKAPGAVVGAPAAAGKTHKSVAVRPLPAADNGQSAEYAISQDNETPPAAWQRETVFAGLTPNTEYFIFARSAESRNYQAGAPAAETVVTETLNDYIFELPGDKTIRQGESVTLSVDTESPNGGTFSYSWYYWGGAFELPNIETVRENWELYVSMNVMRGVGNAAGSSYQITPTSAELVGAQTVSYFVQAVNTYSGGERTLLGGPINVTVLPAAAPEPDKKPGAAGSAAVARGAVVRGRILSVSASAASATQIRLVDMRGKTVARFYAGGNASFSLAGVPAGRYVLEARERGKSVNVSPVFLNGK